VGVFVTFTAADEKSATQKMENYTIDLSIKMVNLKSKLNYIKLTSNLHCDRLS